MKSPDGTTAPKAIRVTETTVLGATKYSPKRVYAVPGEIDASAAEDLIAHGRAVADNGDRD